MEKYFLPTELDFKHLRKCLDEYEPDSIFIRQVGSKGECVRVDEQLEGRNLDFKKNKKGLTFLIDKKEVFHFPLKWWGTRKEIGFKLEYERFNKNGTQVFLSHGTNPYDPSLPEPSRSILKNCADDHFLEVYFKGRINLEFYRWLQAPHFALWKVMDKLYVPVERTEQ